MNDKKPMRTRMAPSPTGFMHVGTLRTVLYDYFLARQSGGQFVMRIEDTDQEREVQGALESLLRTMKTVGIDYDEGPVLNDDGTITEKGPYGSYIQSKRLNIYRPYADKLVADGNAYYCFCTSERLAKMREEQMALKQAPRYDRTCLKLSADEVKERLAQGESHVIRLKVPEGETRFVDAIRGEIVIKHAEVDDQVLIKSDGFPTYHMAVVVDDELMKISHVVRGEEWVSSAPKQIILQKMLGFSEVVFAHVPLLLNTDKTKLSKRKGDVSVESYLAKGYLPVALINFLALLGWNPTGDREIYELDELINLFDLSKVNKAGAVMNIEKLDWTNHEYLKKLSEADYLAWCYSCLENPKKDELERRVLLIARERVRNAADVKAFLIANDSLFQESAQVDPALVLWKTQPKEEAIVRLEGVKSWIESQSDEVFASIQKLDEGLRAFIQEEGWGNGDTLWPLRVSLSGMKQSPSPFELLFVLGKERSLKRIDEARALLA